MKLFNKKEKPTIKRILIIRFSSIGDIVLTTPVIRAVKRRYPDAALHFLTKKNFKQVTIYNPFIDTIHTLEEDIDITINELKKYKFDYIADLQKNFRSRRIVDALNVPSASFPKLNIRKWLYTNFKINTLPNRSIVERYFEAVKKIGVTNDGEGLNYFIPEEKETKQDDIPMSHWAGYVGCVIGGSFATKKMPVQKWQEFVAKCPYPVILLGGPEDCEEGEQIVLQQEGKVYNACGKFNLTESADLVRRARVVVTNDTGLMHVAAAFKKPIVSLWGNTTPQMGMFPYYGFNDLKENIAPQLEIVEVNNLSCRPCSKLGHKQCPKKHFKCMNNIAIDQIVSTVERFWTL